MLTPNHCQSKAGKAVAACAIYSALALASFHAVAQMPMPAYPAAPSQADATSQPPDSQPQDTQALITKLKQQVFQLLAALQQGKSKGTRSSKGSMNTARPAMGWEMIPSEMGGMSSIAQKPPMGPRKDDAGEMGAMAPPAGPMSGASAAPMGGKGCCGMSMGKPMPKTKGSMPGGMAEGRMGGGMAEDKMGGMSGGGMPSKGGAAMSGSTNPEAPHLLHVGAKDFYLDHAQRLALTPEQKMALTMIRSDAMQQKATPQKQIDAAEQELWQLTSAEQPYSAGIDSKLQQIAKFKGDQQVAFIHSAAKASNVLTPEQRIEVVKPMPTKGRMRSQLQNQ